MNIASLTASAVNTASNIKQGVEDAADSKAGKWVSMAGIVASLTVGATNCQSNYYHHKEAMEQFRKQRAVNEYQLGQPLTSAIESQAVTQTKGEVKK